MDHAVLFPRLRDNLRSNHVFAVVEGDDAHDPPWQEEWKEFLAKWIYKLNGQRYEPDRADSDHGRFMTRYRDWVDVAGAMSADIETAQSIEHFIGCQHSRDAFAPEKMGADMDHFDNELRSILEPHALDDVLNFTVRTKVEWGSIKR